VLTRPFAVVNHGFMIVWTSNAGGESRRLESRGTYLNVEDLYMFAGGHE